MDRISLIEQNIDIQIEKEKLSLNENISDKIKDHPINIDKLKSINIINNNNNNNNNFGFGNDFSNMRNKRIERPIKIMHEKIFAIPKLTLKENLKDNQKALFKIKKTKILKKYKNKSYFSLDKANIKIKENPIKKDVTQRRYNNSSKLSLKTTVNEKLKKSSIIFYSNNISNKNLSNISKKKFKIKKK